MNFLSALSFFRSKNQQRIGPVGDEFFPTLWEDDYSQIEIVPQENWDFIINECKSIEALFLEQHGALGFSNSYVRKSLPVSNLSREIRVDALEDFLLSSQLIKANRINYQGTKSLDCKHGQIKAYGGAGCTIFFDAEEDFVENIWIDHQSFQSLPKVNSVEKVLYQLGEMYEFILIDWNRLQIIDLRNLGQVVKYLSK